MQRDYIGLLENLVKRRLRVDRAGIDRQAGLLGREAAFGLRKAELMPNKIHQVGGVLAVMDCEGRIEADIQSIVAQQARADGVESPRPCQAIGHDGSPVAEHLGRDA